MDHMCNQVSIRPIHDTAIYNYRAIQEHQANNRQFIKSTFLFRWKRVYYQ
jgi:hypothetical protein